MAALQRRCRVCAGPREGEGEGEGHGLGGGVLVFGARGQQLRLRDSIRRYLQLEISIDDKLPKIVCLKCCTQIDTIKNFAEMACESQYTLIKQLELLENGSDQDGNDDLEIKEEIDNTNIDENSIENNSNEDNITSEEEEDITEMEVRLDPMMFLDSNSEEDSQSNDSHGFNRDMVTITPEEECATLTKIENQSESLTIELVRVSDLSPKPDYEKKGRALPDLKPIIQTKKYTQSETVRPYVCTTCPRSFFSSIALQNHSWLHLNKEADESYVDGKYSCPVCRKTISTKGNLKVHMETHRPKGKYNCDICGRVFKTQSNLYRHKEYHGGEVYTCNVCGRVYPTNSTLRAHSVTHSDARPHNCPLCKKTFKRNQDLKFHINQHTGERPYRCPYCPKAFASSGNCFSHRKRMHPVEVERDRGKTLVLNSLS